MIEIWYTILAFTLTVYLVLDGRNFGAGAIHLLIAKTGAERRQVVAAIGPLWSWHEVWLLAVGGVLFVAFPRVMATAFTGYYLAIYLLLWCLILRGISIEVGGHINNPLWQQFWDFFLVVSSLLLAILSGVALGNVARGIPLDGTGNFQMAFFTDFRVSGHVGLLDWYTISTGAFFLLLLCAHGATYLTHKTEGPVHDRSERLTRRLWLVVCIGLIAVSVETWIVRPSLFSDMPRRPLAMLAVIVVAVGFVAVVAGIRRRNEMLALAGSSTFIAGFLGAAAASVFPVMLLSTLGMENSVTAYNSAASRKSLLIAIVWWPIAFALASTYFVYILHQYRGKVKPQQDTQGFY